MCISRLEMYISRLEIYISRLEIQFSSGFGNFFQAACLVCLRIFANLKKGTFIFSEILV